MINDDFSYQLLRTQAEKEYRELTAAMTPAEVIAFQRGIEFLYQCSRGMNAAALQDIAHITGGKNA